MEAQARRERLEQLLSLAQTYRGWTKKLLAKSLGRDTTKLVPESGLPKLDLLIDLARVLDWTVDEVANHIWGGTAATANPEAGEKDFASLAAASQRAHREGDYMLAVEQAQMAGSVAAPGAELALACVREASGWDGLGRYTRALEATKRGLAEPGVPTDERLMLQANLAIEYYTLWDLLDARTMAQDLIQHFEASPPTTRTNRVIQAFSHYVRGHSYRRLMRIEPGQLETYGRLASGDLLFACNLLRGLADDYEEDSYRGSANTCWGGHLEAEVATGGRTAVSVLDEISEGLTKLIDVRNHPRGDWLESHGWWCIFGCNVALNHLADPREIQQRMAMYTTKADEIADRLDNWAIRERVFSMDYVRRQRFADWTGVASDWMIDKNDVKMIAGAMGRFPGFKATGWQILQSATVVADN